MVNAGSKRTASDAEKANTFAAWVEARPDGKFQIQVPPGEYVITAKLRELTDTEIVRVSKSREAVVSLVLGGARAERPKDGAGTNGAADGGTRIGGDGGTGRGGRGGVRGRDGAAGGQPVPRDHKPLPRHQPTRRGVPRR